MALCSSLRGSVYQPSLLLVVAALLARPAGGAGGYGADVHVVVPTYNEAKRLPIEQYVGYARKNPSTHFTFVDDGSTDETLKILRALSARLPEQMHVLPLEQNQGKAEATRQGLLAAAATRAAVVGFWDADLATPLGEMHEFISVLNGDANLQMVFGARVALLGRDIRRLPSRHYLGRVFATLASWVLSLRIYDTQCGAKLFRNTPAFHSVIASPFGSRWIFDVEMIARFIAQRRHAILVATAPEDSPETAQAIARENAAAAENKLGPLEGKPSASKGELQNGEAGTDGRVEGTDCWEQGRCPGVGPPLASVIYEIPLREWADIAGSKIKFGDKFAALAELAEVWYTYFSPWASWTGGLPGADTNVLPSYGYGKYEALGRPVQQRHVVAGGAGQKNVQPEL